MAEEAKEQTNETQEPENAQEAQEGTENAGSNASADDGAEGTANGVKDSHGQPGINKERHDKEMAAKDAEIAELKKQIAEAAKTEEGRKALESKIAKLEADHAADKAAYELKLAGCTDEKKFKAAQKLLSDYEGKVDALKADHPYLFETKQQGSTGAPPAGASDALDKKLDKAFGLS